MSIFRFQRFQVENKVSAMKVNTDGVLLGALMTVRAGDLRNLDIGTGTGTVALMAAQRLSDCAAAEGGISREGGTSVLGIDVDGPSAGEAALNFQDSPWPEILQARQVSLAEFSGELLDSTVTFDHIFSNPPYFDDSLQAPEARRNAARHSGSLSYRDILEFAGVRLSREGVLSFVLPHDGLKTLVRQAASFGLPAFRLVHVRTSPRKPWSRIIAEFSRERVDKVEESELTLMENGAYTREYRELTSDFYLWERR